MAQSERETQKIKDFLGVSFCFEAIDAPTIAVLYSQRNLAGLVNSRFNHLAYSTVKGKEESGERSVPVAQHSLLRYSGL